MKCITIYIFTKTKQKKLTIGRMENTFVGSVRPKMKIRIVVRNDEGTFRSRQEGRIAQTGGAARKEGDEVKFI